MLLNSVTGLFFGITKVKNRGWPNIRALLSTVPHTAENNVTALVLCAAELEHIFFTVAKSNLLYMSDYQDWC